MRIIKGVDFEVYVDMGEPGLYKLLAFEINASVLYSVDRPTTGNLYFKDKQGELYPMRYEIDYYTLHSSFHDFTISKRDRDEMASKLVDLGINISRLPLYLKRSQRKEAQ